MHSRPQLSLPAAMFAAFAFSPRPPPLRPIPSPISALSARIAAALIAWPLHQASGQVAGESSAASTQERSAFLYSNGQLINLGTLGGEYGNGADQHRR